MWWLSMVLSPILLGWIFARIAQKCTGKNARNACNAASWGFYLLLLFHIPFDLIPLLFALNKVIYLMPAAICFLMAANSMLKEMKAQRVGEFTDAA